MSYALHGAGCSLQAFCNVHYICADGGGQVERRGKSEKTSGACAGSLCSCAV